MTPRPPIDWLDTVVLSPRVLAARSVVATATHAESLAAYRFYRDGIESHATAIAVDPLTGLRYLPCIASATPPTATSPDSVAASITGAIDIRVLGFVDNWNPASAQAFGITKYKDDVATNVSYMLFLSSSGPQFYWGSAAGVASAVAAGVAAPFARGIPGWLRVTAETDGTITFYWAEFDGTVNEPSSWQTLVVKTATGFADIRDNATVLQINGAQNNNYHMDGGVFRSVVYSGVSGTRKVDFNPNADATTGATSFTSATGEVWTLNNTVALAAQTTSVTVLANRDVIVLLRVRRQETGGANGGSTDDYQYQTAKNGGAYANLTTAVTNGIKAVDSASLTDSNTTAARLTAGTGSFVAGEITEDGLVDDRQLTSSNYTEDLVALYITASQVANGDTFDFRVLRNGSVITYTVTPRITISKTLTYVTQAAGGSISPAGALVKDEALGVAGSISPAGSLARVSTLGVSGAITPAGDLATTLIFVVAVDGSISPVGALAFLTAMGIAGSITPAGDLVRSESIGVSGSMTPTGGVTMLDTLAISGSISPAGSLTQLISMALAGSISPTAELTRALSLGIVGSITPTGAIEQAIAIALSGAIGPTGDLSRDLALAVAGSITPAGDVARDVTLELTGGILPDGSLGLLVSIAMAGETSPSGAVDFTVPVAVGDAVIDPIGLLEIVPTLELVGAISPDGAIERSVAFSVGGSLTPGGTLVIVPPEPEFTPVAVRAFFMGGKPVVVVSN